MFLSARLGAIVVAVLAGASVLVVAPATGQTSPPGGPQQGLVASLRDRSDGPVTIDRDPVTGAVTFVGTASGAPLATPTEASAGPTAAAGRFVTDFGRLFGAATSAELERESVTPRVDGGATVRYQQVTGDVPVMAGELVVQLDENGDVLSALGELQPGVDVSTDPGIAPEVATAAALEATARAHEVAVGTLSASDPERWVYAPDLLGGPSLGFTRLTWRLEVTGPGSDEPVRELVLVDAATGGIALQFNQVASSLNRKICDFNNAVIPDETCIGPFARVEGQAATGNPDVDDAFDYSGDTYNFFFNRFGRDSVDDNGLELRSTVRYCPSAGQCPYANAFWNGSQMTYGEGYASADDVVGHELTHGVTDFSSRLFYYFQSGAINESLSDVFGEYMDLNNGAGNDTAGVRWLMGEDLSIGAIRSMSNPPAFGDPDTMSSANYTLGLDDGGGVHTNSGVSNKVAFLLADGGSFNGHTVPALGITKAARIYYEAATTLLVSGSDYADLSRALPQACTNVIGTDGITSADCAGVQQAVDAVEMSTNPPIAPTTTAPAGCASGQGLSTVFSDDLENTASGRWAIAGTLGPTWAYPQNPNPFSGFGFDATYTTSGDTNFFAADTNRSSDTTIARTANVVLPQGSALIFNHAFETELGFDGGRVEYSTNSGGTWTDAGPLFSAGGYNSHVNGPGGPAAFSGLGHGYGSSRIDLASLAGQNFRFRFRFTSDSSIGRFGWFIDDVRIISCQTARPANDNFGNARVVRGGTFDVTGTNRGATEQAGEPNHAGNRGGASVWFRWTAPQTRFYTIRTTGSSFDTLLAIYRGRTVSGLTRVVANDDAATGGLQSRVRFRATRGAAYRIAVDGYAGSGAAATGTIRLRAAPS